MEQLPILTERVKKAVYNYLKNNEYGSVLLSGAHFCGQFAAAKYMARTVLCTEPNDGKPCGECPSCKLSLMAHPDFHVVAQGEKNSLGVDVADEIHNIASVYPAFSECSVVLVDGMDRMTQQAQNSLLKLTEESKFIKIIGIACDTCMIHCASWTLLV